MDVDAWLGYEKETDNMGEFDMDKDGNKMMGGPMFGPNDEPVGLDPGVDRLVRWLRSHGFMTSDSGDGKTKFEQGWTDDDGVCLYAHVVISINNPSELIDEADRLKMLLWEEHGIDVEPTPPEPPDPPQMDTLYFVTSRTGMIILKHVDDSMLRKTNGHPDG
jgi:hypothetical protein